MWLTPGGPWGLSKLWQRRRLSASSETFHLHYVHYHSHLFHVTSFPKILPSLLSRAFNVLPAKTYSLLLLFPCILCSHRELGIAVSRLAQRTGTHMGGLFCNPTGHTTLAYETSRGGGLPWGCSGKKRTEPSYRGTLHLYHRCFPASARQWSLPEGLVSLHPPGALGVSRNKKEGRKEGREGKEGSMGVVLWEIKGRWGSRDRKGGGMLPNTIVVVLSLRKYIFKDIKRLVMKLGCRGHDVTTRCTVGASDDLKVKIRLVLPYWYLQKPTVPWIKVRILSIDDKEGVAKKHL